MNRIRNILFKFFVIFATLITFIATGVGGVYGYYKTVNEMKTWIKSDGVVVSSSIDNVSSPKGGTYCPTIIVKYKFKNKDISSELLLENAPCRPVKVFVKNNIKNYKKGTNIKILINPKKHKIISTPNYSGGLMLYLMIFLAILSFIGFFFVIFTPSHKL